MVAANHMDFLASALTSVPAAPKLDALSSVDLKLSARISRIMGTIKKSQLEPLSAQLVHPSAQRSTGDGAQVDPLVASAENAIAGTAAVALVPQVSTDSKIDLVPAVATGDARKEGASSGGRQRGGRKPTVIINGAGLTELLGKQSAEAFARTLGLSEDTIARAEKGNSASKKNHQEDHL